MRGQRFFAPVVGVFLVAGVLGLGFMTFRLRTEVNDLGWRLSLEQTKDMHGSVIASDVGNIQFIKGEYSIKLDSVERTSTGLRFVGVVGNPFLRPVSTLTLHFEAAEPRYKLRSAYDKEGFLGLFWRTPESKAEVSVGNLPSGSTAPFAVTLPDVKNPDSTEISVRFTGERYGY